MKKIAVLAGILAVLLAALFLAPKVEDRLEKTGAISTEGVFPEITEEKTTKVVMIDKANRVELVKKDGKWFVADGENFEADPRGTKLLFDLYSGLKVDRLVADSEEKFDLFEIAPQEGSTLRFFGEGGEVYAEFIVGRLGPDLQSTFIREIDSEKVYAVQADIKRILTREPSYWRNRVFAAIFPEKIHKLEIEKKGQPTIVLSRDLPEVEAWQLAKPIDWAATGATPEKADAVARTLANLIAAEVKLPDEEPGKDYGFDEPLGTLKVYEFDGRRHDFIFGEQTVMKQVYARKAGNDYIYVLQGWVLERLLPSLEWLGTQQVNP